MRSILFEAAPEERRVRDLQLMTEIDRAHVVMLAERGLMPMERAARLLEAVDDLRRQQFAPLRGRPSPRGLYLAYEDYLIETLGPRVGGSLQMARSRNDLGATLHKLQVRAPFARLARELLRLQGALLGRARRYRTTVMPLYTHGQAAVPITYGHYLAAVASALQRHTAMLHAAAVDLQVCPLGAGAGGGSRQPIDSRRTAMLLGFDGPAENSVDAVASRDTALLLLAASSVVAVTLSRVASDLLQWCTVEFGFLELPDEVVGSSSAMPQKRNPFLLEHVQGRSTATLAAFVGACGAAHAAPFTNAASVGTESVRQVPDALRELAECALLLRLVVSRAAPAAAAMASRARRGLTSALVACEALVEATELDFRSAHRAVGALIRSVGERALDTEALSTLAPQWRDCAPALDPHTIASAAVHGGGPGATMDGSTLQRLVIRWRDQREDARALADRWRVAAAALDAATARIRERVRDHQLAPVE